MPYVFHIICHAVALKYCVIGDCTSSANKDILSALKGQMYLIYIVRKSYYRVSTLTGFDSTVRRFKLQAILRRVPRMTPKWPWTLKGQMYHIYRIQQPPGPKFHSVPNSHVMRRFSERPLQEIVYCVFSTTFGYITVWFFVEIQIILTCLLSGLVAHLFQNGKETLFLIYYTHQEVPF